MALWAIGSNVARNMNERKMRTTDVGRNARQSFSQLECGPMPNVMAALPNIGGALYGSSVIQFLVPRRKVWLTPAAGVPCSNAGNIRERKTWT